MKQQRSHHLSRRALLRGGAALGAGLAMGIPSARAASSAGAEASWTAVTALVERYVASRRIPGAIATFGWGDGPMARIVRGAEGFDDGDEIGPDSLFRVYSMTKPVTGMAAMMLVDEGRMALDDPLVKFAPEFADIRVAIDPAKGLDSRPARHPITIRHLLTHTSGLGYAGIDQNLIGKELLRLGVTPASASRLSIPGFTPTVPTAGPDEFLRRAASVPLVAEPGTRWHYSMGLDVLGLVIQRISGAESFGAFLRERIFAPAGMESSFFRVPQSETGRLSTNYLVLGGIAMPVDRPGDSIYLDPTPFAYGGAGLVSTPSDYDRFLQLLVNRGRIGGRKVINARAVALGLSNLLPPGIDTAGTLARGGGFGAGGRVGLGEDAGSFGWSGAAGTIAFVNTRIGLRAGLYVQFMPPEVWPLQQEFLAAAREDALGRIRR